MGLGQEEKKWFLVLGSKGPQGPGNKMDKINSLKFFPYNKIT
jgi:hypothetical protein